MVLFYVGAGLAGNVLWVLGARGSINKPICPGQGIYIKNNNRLKRSAATTLVLLHMRMILVTLMDGI